MYYLLHHSKGTLVFSAEDRMQVVEWGRRQLGKQAALGVVLFNDTNGYHSQKGLQATYAYHLNIGNGIVTAIFTMFILRPNILIEAFKMIINRFNNGKNAS